MKIYKLSWVAVLVIGVALWIFDGIAKILALVLIIISIISLFQKKEKVEVGVGLNKTEK